MRTLAYDLFPTHTVSNTNYQRLPDDLYIMKSKLASLSRILMLHNDHNVLHFTSAITDTWSSYLDQIDSIAKLYDLKTCIDSLVRYFPLSASSDDTTSQLRSEEHTSELQSHSDLVCRLLLEKKKKKNINNKNK